MSHFRASRSRSGSASISCTKPPPSSILGLAAPRTVGSSVGGPGGLATYTAHIQAGPAVAANRPNGLRPTSSSAASVSIPPRLSSQASNDRDRRDSMRLTTTVLPSEDEYDSLPPAVRRKFFSSLERLRLAQQQQEKSAASVAAATQSRNGNVLDHISPNSPPKGSNKLKKTKSSSDAFILSQNDAQWFLDLPETVQRKNFSDQERDLLRSKCESIIADASDEALYRLGKRRNRSLTTVASYPTSGKRSSMEALDVQQSTEAFRQSFRWTEDDHQDLDQRLTLDDYHSQLYDARPNGVAKKKPFRRPSFRRTLSLSRHMPNSQSVTSFAGHRTTPSLSRKPIKPTSGHAHNASITSRSFFTDLDHDATHYQDPEARLKLRVYLASPQKFDEAIEFGFPSTDRNSIGAENVPKSSKGPKAEPDEPRSFFESELFDESDAFSGLSTLEKPIEKDFEKIDEMEIDSNLNSPTTQSETPSTPVQNTITQRMSIGNAFKPRILADPYPLVPAGHREMTLRMTLTRKDLRADEQALYGWQQQYGLGGREPDDALALEELPPVNDKGDGQGGIWGTEKHDDNVVKRFWRKVRASTPKTVRVR